MPRRGILRHRRLRVIIKDLHEQNQDLQRYLQQYDLRIRELQEELRQIEVILAGLLAAEPESQLQGANGEERTDRG
eukprot:11921727-Prorocentrum_lima.AAC.1